MQIRSERGIQGFWAGYSASVILTLNPALTFVLQNLLKQTVVPRAQREKPGPRIVFLLAALSKAAASTITYPVSLAKTRAQVASQSSSHVEKDSLTEKPAAEQVEKEENSGASGTLYKTERLAKKAARIVFAQQLAQLALLRSLQQIYRTEGFLALYSGLSGEVLKGFLGHGFTMLLKERIHVLIINLYFVLLRVTKRWPADLGSVRDQAAKEMGRVKGAAQDMAQDASDKVKTVAEGAKNAVSGEK